MNSNFKSFGKKSPFPPPPPLTCPVCRKEYREALGGFGCRNCYMQWNKEQKDKDFRDLLKREEDREKVRYQKYQKHIDRENDLPPLAEKKCVTCGRFFETRSLKRDLCGEKRCEIFYNWTRDKKMKGPQFKTQIRLEYKRLYEETDWDKKFRALRG